MGRDSTSHVVVRFQFMTNSGFQEFDFLFGKWNVRNKKLVDPTDPKCDDWVEFEGTSDVIPVLDGWGNIDGFFVPESSEQRAFEGLTFRLFNPSSGVWKIWWSSTRAPGVLDPPVGGCFVGDHGVRSETARFRGLDFSPLQPVLQCVENMVEFNSGPRRSRPAGGRLLRG